MNLSHAGRIALASLLTVAAAGSLSITGYLSRLEGGVQQNVRAAQALVDAQKAIRDRNAALSDMVVATNRIGTGLEAVLSRSEQIGQGVKAVAQANRQTLALNGQVEANNADSARELARVLAALRSMNQSAGAIRQYMADVSEIAARDAGALRAIGANTARMDARTPGW